MTRILAEHRQRHEPTFERRARPHRWPRAFYSLACSCGAETRFAGTTKREAMRVWREHVIRDEGLA